MAEITTYLIESFLKNNHVVIDHAFETDLLENLSLEIEQLHLQGLFKEARVGHRSHATVTRRADIRNDSILWIAPEHGPWSKKIYDSLSDLQKNLNESLLLNLSHFEAHYAIYPEGGFYERHVDQSQHAVLNGASASRLISFVLYMNKNWVPADGGTLTLFNPTEEVSEVHVEPIWNRLILFRSDIVEHRVEVSNKERRSVCGWMKTGTYVY